MAQKRMQSKAMRDCLKRVQRCELCGATARTLEAHHVIPIVCGGPDEADNLLAICSKCHALLTPRGVLTKIGIERVRYKNVLNALSCRFYTKIKERLEEVSDNTFGYLDAGDIMDIFDEVIKEEEEKPLKNAA